MAITLKSGPAFILPQSVSTLSHREILDGLPYQKLKDFERESGFTPDEIQKIMSFPSRTRARRKVQRRLSSDESERLVRFARITDLAIQLFEGNRRRALQWLNSPARSFSGETPLSRARTEVGARQVEDLIGRLEHGVFS